MLELLCVLNLVPEISDFSDFIVASLYVVCCWASARYTEGNGTERNGAVRCGAEASEAKRIFRLLAHNKTSSSNRIEKGPGLFYDLI